MDNDKSQTISFCIIKCGKMFINENNHIMMKIKDDLNIYNAVDLTNGCIYTYKKDHLVTPISRISINR